MIDPNWKRFGKRREALAEDGTRTIMFKSTMGDDSGGWKFVVGADGRLSTARADVNGTTIHLYEYSDWRTVSGWEVPGTVAYTLHDEESGKAMWTETRRIESLEPLAKDFRWDPWMLHVAANPELADRTEPD